MALRNPLNPWQTLLFVSESLAMDTKVTPDSRWKSSVWQAMLASFTRPLGLKQGLTGNTTF